MTYAQLGCCCVHLFSDNRLACPLTARLRVEWPDAIAMLREAGEQIGDFDDLSTPQEKLLGSIIKAKVPPHLFLLSQPSFFLPPSLPCGAPYHQRSSPGRYWLLG